MFNLKVRDKPRIRATTTAQKRWPFNLEAQWGHYQRVHVRDGVVHSFAPFSTPPFGLISTPTTDSEAKRPVIVRDERQHTHLLYYRAPSGGATVVYYSVSWDDGATWGAFTTLFNGGMYPMVAADPTTGALVFAALVGTAVRGRIKQPGDLVAGDEFSFVDSSNTPLMFADDTFGLAYAIDQQSRLVGAFHISGESQISEWWSGDDGRSWRRVD